MNKGIKDLKVNLKKALKNKGCGAFLGTFRVFLKKELNTIC